jgi:hypothetical protein
VATTKLLLANGEQLEVEATLEAVMKELENAARSSSGTFARLTQSQDGEPVAINPGQVVTVRPGDE